MAAKKRPGRVRVGRFGDLRGSKAIWRLVSPNRKVEAKVKLVDLYPTLLILAFS
jgi:hypothetical protein